MPIDILNKNITAFSELFERHLNNLHNTELLENHLQNLQNTELLERHLNNVHSLTPSGVKPPSELPSLDTLIEPLNKVPETLVSLAKTVSAEASNILGDKTDPQTVAEALNQLGEINGQAMEVVQSGIGDFAQTLNPMSATLIDIARTDLKAVPVLIDEQVTPQVTQVFDVLNELAPEYQQSLLSLFSAIRTGSGDFQQTVESGLTALPQSIAKESVAILETGLQSVDFIGEQMLPVANAALKSMLYESTEPTAAFIDKQLYLIDGSAGLLVENEEILPLEQLPMQALSSFIEPGNEFDNAAGGLNPTGAAEFLLLASQQITPVWDTAVN
ncbi:hypothetical protein [Thiomicrorhabdus xiamenensis]|uniref:Uncharacterized protein n=1 Tax=Thiomicrorhabdus xiamenensis TaxID=2739063 RepID=A0A7D4TH76_9GAMM|nr:hypothetical protein [Thiomicrorhabdus xiamenensis]QKI90088.1 hypothetical protein HQN79_11135 [Thiomicrorhabdus xiamenensis]